MTGTGQIVIIDKQPNTNDVVDSPRQWSAVVLIVNLGGNGKTSPAREIAAGCLRDDSDVPQFDAAVWVSDIEDSPAPSWMAWLV